MSVGLNLYFDASRHPLIPAMAEAASFVDFDRFNQSYRVFFENAQAAPIDALFMERDKDLFSLIGFQFNWPNQWKQREAALAAVVNPNDFATSLDDLGKSRLKLAIPRSVPVLRSGRDYIFRDDFAKVLLENAPYIQLDRVGGAGNDFYQLKHAPSRGFLSENCVFESGADFKGEKLIQWSLVWVAGIEKIPHSVFLDKVGFGKLGKIHPLVLDRKTFREALVSVPDISLTPVLGKEDKLGVAIVKICERLSSAIGKRTEAF